MQVLCDIVYIYFSVVPVIYTTKVFFIKGVQNPLFFRNADGNIFTWENTFCKAMFVKMEALESWEKEKLLPPR